MFPKKVFFNKVLCMGIFFSFLIGGFLWLDPRFFKEGRELTPPYPLSPVISEIVWDAEVIRKGVGSDTWPITWADDNNLYTSWADGYGFENINGSKLSLGFSKVTGSAQSFTGIDIDSPSGEQSGDGSSGKKASGILMVNSILYMWVRNADNNGQQCQLAKSIDYGGTWTWSNWNFAEFGYCTFINFGKNYDGARDSYVYMVSPDSPSAYTKTDRMILTRVPQNQVMDRDAYEFFRGKKIDGSPIWESDVNQRQPVFINPGQCLRSGISYNPGLGRYLWWQHLPKNNFDTRSSGGFGIYDAPEPWGPWTTAFFSEEWDMGPGETASFPTKWMSADGATAYLLFSGNDAFSVRKATFLLRNPDAITSTIPSKNVLDQAIDN